MFAHREISHKIHGPTRSENVRHLLVWVYRERCEHILHAFWASYTQCLCWFCAARASLRPPLHHPVCSLVNTSRMSQTQTVTHAWWGLDCDMRPYEKKQTKPEFQLRCFPWKARVITRRWMQLLNNFETFFVICCVTARTKKCISSGLHSSPILYFWHVGVVIEHRSVESKGLRFYTSWGLRIFSLSHTRDETKNIFLYFFTGLKTYTYHFSYSFHNWFCLIM